MRMFVCLAVLLGLAGAATAQDNPAVAAAAGQLADLTLRVNAIEQRLAAVESQLGVGVRGERHADATGKRTYAAAYHLALSTGRPLLVWHGTAVCESCVHESEGEFVNYVGPVAGCNPNAVTVSVPEGGELVGVGSVTAWVTGDSVRGHLPSARRLVAGFRQNRTRTAQAASAPPTGYQSVGFAAAPAMGFYGGGMMTGGCASCGTSSGRVGLFRR